MRPRRPKNSGKRKSAVDAGYRSGFEHDIAKQLEESGIGFEYEKLKLAYLRPVRGGSCNTCGDKAVSKRGIYTPDFVLTSGTNMGAVIELKGRLTSSDRTKLAAVRQQHPKIDLRLLFAADNFCTKTHRERYSDWAIRIGIRHAVGKRLPTAWIN